jgi:hypothetical protein
MSDPIRERIVENALSALEGISTRKGYYHTVREVVHTPLNPITSFGKPLIGVFLEAGRLTREGAPIGSERSYDTLQVEGWLDESDNSGEKAIRFLSDIETAIMDDPSRGGVADTMYPITFDIFYAPPDQTTTLTGVVMRFEVLSTYTIGSP